MKHEVSRISIDLPTTTHKKFKKLAAQHGMSMRQIVVNYIVEKISQETKECPYDHTPNATTLKALKDIENGKGLTRCKDIKDLCKKCGI
jgi:antitoxin component of RelBE/YafQ-DinJ toxin-antitoxin module